MFCSHCGTELLKSAKFCAACGRPVDIGSAATLLGSEDETLAASTPGRTPAPASGPPKPSSSGSSLLSSSGPIGGGRFAPGTILAGRYRIVALAGRGGMGEVYRADDLKLGQTVAIKFLPEALTHDPSALERFHSEVRLARHVSHPNVCRVFDICESEGVTYLTMEYVDGEDLGSLIRRIGRFSPDKAIEIARQICAGLAAAHDRGVIHRDLKPANVMLDGQGKVRITDFGLAGIAESIQGAEIRAGTPVYMAPEQLAGKEVTFKSDLYALGLILYELVTGKRAYEAATFQELMKLREQSTPTNPSALVKDLDPLAERVILRCLERDPAKRPSSAIQVAAALPGGDPLAAALAAGETPSPQMVAAAGESTGFSPRAAVACLAAVLAGLVLVVFLAVNESGLERMHLENPPDVLAQKAREVVNALGYTERPEDRAFGFSYDTNFLDYVDKTDKPHPDWDAVLNKRSPLLNFWYRQSALNMTASGFWAFSLTPGVVTAKDPPGIVPGMISLRLDPQGRLLEFSAVPPEKEVPPQFSAAPDWSPLFTAAKLDASQLRTSQPTWTPPVATDARAAWDGAWPESARPLHVEAAAFHGKPVYFALIGPWTKPSHSTPAEKSAADRMNFFLALCLIFGVILLAYRNYSKKKADRGGAWRLAAVIFALEILIWMFRSHFASATDSLYLSALAVSTGCFLSGVMWMLYVALEPYIRRQWPQTIISWTRLLEGRLRDPLVGRDLLSGVLLGTAWVLVFELGYRYNLRSGDQPLFGVTDVLLGTRETVAIVLSTIVNSILSMLIFFLLLVFLRVLLRNRWLAAAVFVAIFSLPKILHSSHQVVDGIVWVAIYAIAAVAVVRFGLMVLATAVFMANALLNLPYTLNFSSWYAFNSYLVLSACAAIAIWGFYASLGGKTVFKDELFE